jgi:hypothetical protein
LRNPGYLVPYLAEALDELIQRFAFFLANLAQVIKSGVAVGSGLEVGHELLAEILPGGDRLLREVHEPGAGNVLQRHREPIGQNLLVSSSYLSAYYA